jgi:hypothetical protein
MKTNTTVRNYFYGLSLGLLLFSGMLTAATPDLSGRNESTPYFSNEFVRNQSEDQSGKIPTVSFNEELLTNVTCYVSLSTNENPAGTEVSLTGLETPFNFYILTVPQTGYVIFQDVEEGSYILKASKPGFEEYQLSTEITSNNNYVIQLQEIRYKPRHLRVDSLTLVTHWDAPNDILINENFEGAEFPPPGWQALTQNYTGWYGTTDGSSEDFFIPPHSTYAVVNDDADNGNGCCDYLITPELDLTNQSSYKLSFSSFYTGKYSQRAYVEISINGGTIWTIIHVVSPNSYYYWLDVEVDLSQYAGQNGLNSVLLAFHADDVGVWASGWAVDDVVISSSPIPVLGYALTLDEVFISNTNDTTYTFQNLTYGQEYLAGVSALYSSGYSEPDTFRFVSRFLSPPLNLQGTIPAQTDYAQLGWEEPYNFSNPGSPVPGLTGYNIYRNDIQLTYVQFPETEFFDMNLIPGFYTYKITAVYDLTDYGFPGETGESMTEGPIDLALICCEGLPFAESFNTGLFETNQWTVDPGNWRIAGLSGNEAPSAEFYHSPDTLNYSQSLTSFFIIGTYIIDGAILLEFDLKHTLVNPTGNEFLAVEVFDGLTWLKVGEYSNVSSFDWARKQIVITRQVKGRIFNIRFRAYGVNSSDIMNWMVDNIYVYRECAPPTNLYAEVNFPHLDEILLTWEAPVGSTGSSAWLKWDNGINNDAIGLSGGGTFSVAVRFTPGQLEEYAGTALTKIRLFPYATGGSIFLKVWSGANAGQLLVNQPVISYTAGMWNEFSLITPVEVTGTTELWFGYTIMQGSDFVAGCDTGPAIAGFGDMISLNGVDWESMATAYALNYNWNLQGFVEYFDGNIALLPVVDKNVYGPVSQPACGNLPTLPDAAVPIEIPYGNRQLAGYNIWRNNELLATTNETSYIDEDINFGTVCCYTVTAVYEDCESIESNKVCLFEPGISEIETDNIIMYPNPTNNVVNIELTNDISQIVVYNFVGQVVYKQVITRDKTIRLNVSGYEAGAYLVKFITSTGESFTKKVAVTH